MGKILDNFLMEHLLIPIEYRADDSNDSPGLLSGVLMTYGTRGRRRAEMFEQDAFHWSAEGIVIRELHPKPDGPVTPPILRTVPFLEGRELKISTSLPNTTRGRDVAESMKGPLPLYGGLSVEFAAEKQANRNGVRVISRAYLDGAALVLRGEYADSIVEVREDSGIFTPRSVYQWL